ncbi:MAG: translation initiation factor IF-2 N-terminal domain-containing protein, partial [Anaeromyxobacteraceae bacterium]
MSKKRVHELAKQLKEQGIELSNQELVDRLHQFGFDVKSHSSSLDDDQAQSAYEKIVGERKPKAAPVRASGPGFVVRKKAHVEPVPEPIPAPVAAVAPPVVEEAPVVEAPPPGIEEPRHEEVVAESPAAAALVAAPVAEVVAASQGAE